MNKRLIIYVTLSALYFSCLGQNSRTILPHKIKTRYINFMHMDSLMEFSLLIEPNKNFSFREGFIDNSTNRFIMEYERNGVFYQDSLIIDTQNIIELTSKFESFIKDSSSLKNNYPVLFEFIPGILELSYSFLLSNLNEPRLPREYGKKQLRFIIPRPHSGNKIDYYVIRVDFGNNTIHYKSGQFDSEYNYQILINESANLNKKYRNRLTTRLESIDFGAVDYFAEVGPDIYFRYLIEYFDGSEYFVFEKQLMPRNRKLREFNRLLSLIHNLTNRTIEIN
jgi:hypothetical protein